MAKKVKNAKNANVVNEIGFKQYLEYNGNVDGLAFIDSLERRGHKLTVKGGGYIAKIDVDSIYGYDVFEIDKNKAIFVDILQNSSSISESAVILAYCVINNSAHLLIKGDDEQVVKGYLNVILSHFEKRYNGGKQNVGYPFRSNIKFKQVSGKQGIWRALTEVHGYSPADCRSYPYNSYAYLMEGNSMANMVLGIELDIINPSEFNDKLMEKARPYGYRGAFAPEQFNIVMEDLRVRYLSTYGRVKENALAFVLGEASARTGKPYIYVAKKAKCYKNRHDLTVTTLCDFIYRRGCDYQHATSILGMGSENAENLLIETIIELNRLHKYSYDYILNNVLKMYDEDYALIATVFCHLHAEYKWEFATLCEKYHVKRDFLKIRELCDF